MVSHESAWLAPLFLIVALFYASVGQAGASGYLAVMSLFGMTAASMKVTALALNLVVAGIGTFQFWRRGLFSLRTFYPFALLGIPFSLLGGATQLPAAFYNPIVGLILILSAAQMFRSAWKREAPRSGPMSPPPFLPALITGGVIGLVSGLTGTGGGLFLAPIILAMRWVDLRHAAAVTAGYNLLNSGAALVGAYSLLEFMPSALPIWMIAVAIGGYIGAAIGARYLSETALRSMLGLILVVSGVRLALIGGH